MGAAKTGGAEAARTNPTMTVNSTSFRDDGIAISFLQVKTPTVSERGVLAAQPNRIRHCQRGRSLISGEADKRRRRRDQSITDSQFRQENAAATLSREAPWQYRGHHGDA